MTESSNMSCPQTLICAENSSAGLTRKSIPKESDISKKDMRRLLEQNRKWFPLMFMPETK